MIYRSVVHKKQKPLALFYYLELVNKVMTNLFKQVHKFVNVCRNMSFLASKTHEEKIVKSNYKNSHIIVAFRGEEILKKYFIATRLHLLKDTKSKSRELGKSFQHLNSFINFITPI